MGLVNQLTSLGGPCGIRRNGEMEGGFSDVGPILNPWFSILKGFHDLDDYRGYPEVREMRVEQTT